jgi:hypothetical protein
MKTLLLFVFSTITISTFAQRFEWVSFNPLAVLNSNAGSGGLVIAGDEAGHVFTVSNFNDAIIVGEDTLYHGGNLNRPDLVLVKWSEQGEVLAYRHFLNFSTNGNPEAQGMLYDYVNNQLLLSMSSYYAGTPVTLVGNEVEEDLPLSILTGSVLRFDNDLNFISKADIPGGSTYFSPIAMHNGIIFSAHGYNLTVSRINEDNTVAWSHTLQGGFSTFLSTDIQATSEYVYVIGGMVDGFGMNQAMTLNGFTIVPPAGSASGRTFIFKLDHEGNVLDGRFICETYNSNQSLRLAIGNDGAMYMCAGYNISGQAVGNFTLGNLTGSTDGFVAKLDEDFTPQWVTELHHTGGNLETRDIIVTEDGKVTVTGLYGGDMNFADTNFDVAIYGSGYLVQLDASTGAELYGTNFGSLSAGTGRPHAMWNNGTKYFITGLSYGSNDNGLPGTAKYGCFTNTSLTMFITCFNDVPLELPTVALNYENAMFTLSVDGEAGAITWYLDGEVIDNENGLTLASQGPGLYTASVDYFGCEVSADYIVSNAEINENDIIIYPNPASDFITVEGIELGNSIIFYNSIGTKCLDVPINQSNQRIDLTNLPTGVYLLRDANGKRNLGRVVVESRY